MKILLHSLLAGPDGVLQPGIHDVADEVGNALVAGRYATSLVVPNRAPAIEAAIDLPVENAATIDARRGPGRPRKV